MKSKARAQSTGPKLSLDEALARVPAEAEFLTVEQFMFVVGITSPFPIYKWTYQTRVKAHRLYARKDVIAFIRNRFKSTATEPIKARRRTSKKGDRRWYESAFLRKGLDLLACTGATGRLESDRRRLHELLDTLLDELGAESFGALLSEQVVDFGKQLSEADGSR